MNIYKITTKPEWNPAPSYHAGNSIADTFKGTNRDFQRAVTAIVEIETGLSYYQCYQHKIPLTISEEY